MAYDLEQISAKVHEQWMASKLAKGVTTRRSESGEELMVPYSELSEGAKDLDRGSVKATLSAIESIDNNPKRVVISGSSRFIDIMAVCAWLLERDEGKIAMGLHLLPTWYPNCPDHHLAEAENVAPAMDELHLRKIDLCDEVFVVNFNDYIGDSTRREIEYAQKINKPLRWFTDDPIGGKVRSMFP